MSGRLRGRRIDGDQPARQDQPLGEPNEGPFRPKPTCGKLALYWLYYLSKWLCCFCIILAGPERIDDMEEEFAKLSTAEFRDKPADEQMAIATKIITTSSTRKSNEGRQQQQQPPKKRSCWKRFLMMRITRATVCIGAFLTVVLSIILSQNDPFYVNMLNTKTRNDMIMTGFGLIAVAILFALIVLFWVAVLNMLGCCCSGCDPNNKYMCCDPNDKNKCCCGAFSKCRGCCSRVCKCCLD